MPIKGNEMQERGERGEREERAKLRNRFLFFLLFLVLLLINFLLIYFKSLSNKKRFFFSFNMSS